MLGEELEAKIKRKSVATKINRSDRPRKRKQRRLKILFPPRLMDETDRKLEDIKGLLEHGV